METDVIFRPVFWQIPMDSFDVIVDVRFLLECLTTDFTFEWFFTRVDQDMLLQG